MKEKWLKILDEANTNVRSIMSRQSGQSDEIIRNTNRAHGSIVSATRAINDDILPLSQISEAMNCIDVVFDGTDGENRKIAESVLSRLEILFKEIFEAYKEYRMGPGNGL